MFARCLVLAAAVMAAAAPARAGVTLTTTPSAAPPGGAGTFDVILSVDSPPPVDIAGFGFRLTVSNPGFTFTSVGYGPNYLLDGVSLSQFFGDPGPAPGFTPGTAVDANDVVFDLSLLTDFVTVSPGQSFTLARIGYSIAHGVPPGTSAGLAFDMGFTSITVFNAVAITPTTNVGGLAASGTDVQPVPEPATAVALLAAAGLVAVRRRTRV